MLSSEDVKNAYRLILGREPETTTVIEERVRTVPDIGTLRKRFLESEEFVDSRVVKLSRVLDQGPPLRVDVEVDFRILKSMLARVERTWQALGKSDPFWSVLSGEEYRLSNFGQNATQFYDSGREDLQRLMAWLERNGISNSSLQSCCEYGCGTGRVTRWMATRFSRVIACDISEPHLKLAREHIERIGLPNVSFKQIESLEKLKSLEPVDVVFSSIVLQHNPPPVIAFILANLFSCLKPGGIAFFQVPTYCSEYQFIAEHYLSQPITGAFEMHLLPQRYIYAIAKERGCEPVEVQPDGCVGAPQWISNTFLFRKQRLSA